MAQLTRARFWRRVALVLAAVAVTVPLMTARADAGADPNADIYWSANPRTGSSVIGHIPHGTTTTSYLYTNLTGAQAIASDGTYVYWAIPNAIWRAPLDGSGPPQSFITGTFSAQALAIDAEDGLIYWADKVTRTIGRTLLLPGSIPPNGFTIHVVDTPSGLAVDGKNGYLYWTIDSIATIGRAHVTQVDSVVVTPAYLQGLNGAEGIAVDGTYLYWANGISGIGRAPLDGSSPPIGQFVNGASVGPSVNGAANEPTGMAVDGSFIYWVNHRDYAIGQAPITGSPTISTTNNLFVRTLIDPTGVVLNGVPVQPGPMPPPPPPPAPVISVLATGVQTIALPHGLERSLLAKLASGQQRLDGGDKMGACHSLQAFITEVEAQRGKKIEEPSAVGLITQATSLRQTLGCTTDR